MKASLLLLAIPLAACGARSALPIGEGRGGASTGSSSATSSGAAGAGGAASCVAPFPAFARSFEDTLFEGLAADDAGGTFVKGSYWPDKLLGPNTKNALEYVLRLLPSGDVDWAVPLPGPMMTGYGSNLRAIATDGKDAFVATGDGGMAFTRIQSSGDVLWQVRAKPPTEQSCIVATSRDATSTLASATSVPVDWGAGPIDAGDSGVFLVSFDAGGGVIWQIGVKSGGIDDLARDDSGNTSVLGSSSTPNAFAPGLPLSSGEFLVVIDGAGAPRSEIDLGTPWRPGHLVKDQAGGLVVTGIALGPAVDFGAATISPTVPGSVVVAHFGLDGTFQGGFALGGATPAGGSGVVGVHCGRLGVAMTSATTLSFGGPSYLAGPEAIGVGWFDPTGKLLKSVGASVASPPGTQLLSIDVDPAGAPVLALFGADAMFNPKMSNQFLAGVVKLGL